MRCIRPARLDRQRGGGTNVPTILPQPAVGSRPDGRPTFPTTAPLGAIRRGFSFKPGWRGAGGGSPHLLKRGMGRFRVYPIPPIVRYVPLIGALPRPLEWFFRDTRSQIAHYRWRTRWKIKNAFTGALFAGFVLTGIVVGVVTFGSAAMAQNYQYGGGGQQWQQGRSEAQQNGYYGSSSGSYAPTPGWRWQPRRCWIERIPGSGMGPQRVCR